MAQVQNTVFGFATFANAAVQYTTIQPKYIGWGTGGAALANATDVTTPAAPTSTVRTTNATVSAVTTTNSGDTYQVVGTVTATGTVAITEVGLFTNSTSANGCMTVYGNFGSISLVSGDSISFTVQVKFSYSPDTG